MLELIAAEEPRASELITIDGPALPIPPAIDGAALAAALPGLPRAPIEEGVRATLTHFRRLRDAGWQLAVASGARVPGIVESPSESVERKASTWEASRQMASPSSRSAAIHGALWAWPLSEDTDRQTAGAC